MKRTSKLFTAAAATFGLSVTGAMAQDTTTPQPNPPVQEQPTASENQNAEEGVIKPQQQGEQADRQAKKSQLRRVENVVGSKIRNPEGKDLGEVEVLVVDVNSGDIRYAVVSYGGFLDIGDKLFAVPMKAMSLNENEDGDAFFVVDINQEKLENSKGFDDDNWPNFADQEFTSGVDQTYGIETSQPQASAQKAALYKLSTFEGVNVRDKGNKELGEVEWILIDPQAAKVSHLGLDLEDDIETEANDDAYVLVPMNQFRLTTQGDDTFLQASADVEKIRSAPAVTEEELNKPEGQKELRQKVDSHFGAAGLKSDAPVDQTEADVEQPETENVPE